MKDNWRIIEGDKTLVDKLSYELSLDPKIVHILVNRGFKTASEINDFLNPHPSQMFSPFLLSGMREAIELIRETVDKKQRIGIFADSDLDGLTSLALMLHVLEKQSQNIFYRFPKENEGYGLTSDIIDEFHAEKVELLITVDSGIRDIVEIAYARSLGIKVIVTDHHEPDEKLPDAVIVNPLLSVCPYPNKKLAGVGVAFKLCHGLLLSYLPFYNMSFFLLLDTNNGLQGALIENGLSASTKTFGTISEAETYIENAGKNLHVICATPLLASLIKSRAIGELVPAFVSCPKTASYTEIAAALNIKNGKPAIELLADVFFELQRLSSPKIKTFFNYALSLVAIGSIADVMPLTGENRVLTACGLSELGRTPHQGLATVLDGKQVSAKTIGWELAPLLNSPGRFGKAALTADFFINNYICEDSGIIKELHNINKERKALIDASVGGKNKATDRGRFITAFYDDIPEGMAGLIANRLMDKTGKPAIVLIGQAGDSILKGSGRAPQGFDFFSLIAPVMNMLERAGGHAQAFGFSIAQENVNGFFDKISELFEAFKSSGEPVLNIDIELQSADVTADFFKLLSRIEPFGKENEEPLFLMRDVELDSFSRFGKQNNHGRFILNTNRRLPVIGWNMASEMESMYNSRGSADLVFTLEEDAYMGKKNIRLMLVDMG